MTGASMEMVLRARIAAQTRDQFLGLPFAWGKADCVVLAVSHLRRVGRFVDLLPAGRYQSPLGARKALKRAGFASLADALDAQGLERIAPASARLGDILSGNADHPLGALGVYLGNGAMIGWSESKPEADVLRRLEMTGAWRVPHG